MPFDIYNKLNKNNRDHNEYILHKCYEIWMCCCFEDIILVYLKDIAYNIFQCFKYQNNQGPFFIWQGPFFLGDPVQHIAKPKASHITLQLFFLISRR